MRKNIIATTVLATCIPTTSDDAVVTTESTANKFSESGGVISACLPGTGASVRLLVEQFQCVRQWSYCPAQTTILIVDVPLNQNERDPFSLKEKGSRI